jgi:MAC/Perforin domain
MPAVSEAQKTEDDITGLSMLGFGYDVFSSPYCVADECKDEGGGALLNLGPSSKTVHALGRTFSYPDAVTVFGQQPTNDDYTLFGRTVEQYSRQLAVKAQVGASYGAFSGSIQSSYQETGTTYLENVYGEHGHIYSGVAVRLPSKASTLRALLKPEVKTILREHSSADVIKRYGTHLVAGVMIGGKALLRQKASRSNVSSSTEWQLALEAKYGQVTASGSVDQKYSSDISSFQMANSVHTIGGSNTLIESSDQFQAWLTSLDGNPAIIDMIGVVPLWQLLESGSERDRLKAGIVAYAKTFQPGALRGGVQLYNNLDSSGSWIAGATTLDEVGRPVSISQAKSWYNNDFRNSDLRLYLSTGMERTRHVPLAIYGGRQLQSNDRSTEPWKEISSWGVRTTATGESLQEIKVFGVYTNCAAPAGYGDGGFSQISFFVGPIDKAADEAFVVVGGHAIFEDGRRFSDWGQQIQGDLQEQQIATDITWLGDWKPGRIFLHLQEVQNDLAEIPE